MNEWMAKVTWDAMLRGEFYYSLLERGRMGIALLPRPYTTLLKFIVPNFVCCIASGRTGWREDRIKVISWAAYMDVRRMIGRMIPVWPFEAEDVIVLPLSSPFDLSVRVHTEHKT